MIVMDELITLGIHMLRVELGEAEIIESITAKQYDLIKVSLLKWGLELMDEGTAIAI